MERADLVEACRHSGWIAPRELGSPDRRGRARFAGPIRTVRANAERVLVAGGELA